MQEVQVLEPMDVLKANYNFYLDKRIANEVNLAFYKWKIEHLANGEDINKIKENLQNSEHNIKTFSKYIEIIEYKIKQLEAYKSQVN